MVGNGRFSAIAVLGACALMAQSTPVPVPSKPSRTSVEPVYKLGPDIMTEDTQGRRRSLGPGFNLIPISDQKFLFIRGAEMGYGERSSCERPEAKNRVMVYDTKTSRESLLFDKPLSAPMMVA